MGSKASGGTTVIDERSVPGLDLLARQAEGLQNLLHETLPRNRFYTRKFMEAGANGSAVRDISDLRHLPFTTKSELLADQEKVPPYGSALTYPIARYSRLHQTSGTSGHPLRWLDTPGSWNWILDCWEQFFAIVGIGPGDRLFFPFSFGPFLGFWTAFEAASRLGIWCLPGGGMSSAARLRFMLDHEATVVFCTPTYALRLAEVAATEGIDLTSSPVRKLIVAGEPGGSIAATRERIETAWGARVFDHCGMTEVGALGIECPENPAGLHLLETECIAEVIQPGADIPAKPGEAGELVLTNLGRLGSPLIRYRTGDLVIRDETSCPCGRPFIRLRGGILGRTDDMIHLRGNNVYPSMLEALLRRFPSIAEYRVEVDRSGPMSVLRVELEPANGTANDVAEQVSRAIRDEFLFRAEVRTVAPGTLPRYEMKAKRVIFRQ